MPYWNPRKCPQGGPNPFDPFLALSKASFNNSVYVDTYPNMEGTGVTRAAYTYIDYKDTHNTYRICVVGHIHKPAGKDWIAGKVFIPGWENWDTPTPQKDLDIIKTLPNKKGTFPGNDRYPRLLSK